MCVYQEGSKSTMKDYFSKQQTKKKKRKMEETISQYKAKEVVIIKLSLKNLGVEKAHSFMEKAGEEDRSICMKA